MRLVNRHPKMNFETQFENDSEESSTGDTPEIKGEKISLGKQFSSKAITSTGDDSDETLKCLRSKADRMFLMKDYTEASKIYEHCLRIVPESNVSSRRECMEHLARLFLYQKLPDKALEWALKLHALSVNLSQKMVSWNLLAMICHTLGKYEEELEALHCCLDSHKSNPHLWLRLAYCYSGMFGINIPSSGCTNGIVRHCCDFQFRTVIPNAMTKNCGTKNECLESAGTVVRADSVSNGVNCCLDDAVEGQSSNHAPDERVEKCEMCTLGTQIITACLIRTRLLMDSFDCNHTSHEKNHLINEKISSCLMHMEVEQSFIDEASKMLESEIFGGQKVQDSTSLDAACSSGSQVKNTDTDLLMANNIQSLNL